MWLLMELMRWTRTSTASREEGRQQSPTNLIGSLITEASISSIVNSGCQTQEKIVAANAKTFVVIADYRYVHTED